MANDGALATSIALGGWDESNDVAISPNGRLILTNQVTATLHEVTPTLPSGGTGDITIPSADGALLYVFDAQGKHQETLHSLTGATLFSFGYDTEGHLITITDASSNVTTINRVGSGNPTSIEAPFGQTTTLSLDANGYLIWSNKPGE